MLILGVETTGKEGSLALAEADNGWRVLEVAALEAGAHSAQLIPTLAAMLQRQGLKKTDLGALAVATGPGSFTGLRVGLAAVKALAEVLGAPIAGVSFLEAVAAQGAAPAVELVALVDAGRGQVYCGFYTAEAAGLRRRSEQLLQRDEVTATAGALLLTPDRPLAEALRRRGLAVAEVERPRADLIALLGWKRIQEGRTVTALELEADYIRRSDAELYALPRP